MHKVVVSSFVYCMASKRFVKILSKESSCR